MKSLFSTVQWITWFAGATLAAASLVSYAYSTFETKDDHRRDFDIIGKQLDRMEDKIDLLLIPAPSKR